MAETASCGGGEKEFIWVSIRTPPPKGASDICANILLVRAEWQRPLLDEDPLQELQLSGGVAGPVLLHLLEQTALQHKAVATAEVSDLREEAGRLRSDLSGRIARAPGGRSDAPPSAQSPGRPRLCPSVRPSAA